MQYTYEQYFDRELDYELQQEKDGGDRGRAEKFRYLRKADSQRYINTAIRELVLLNKDRYYAEVKVQLFDSEAITTPGGFGAPITDGVLYVDSREALSSDLKRLTLPPNVAQLMAVQGSNGKWEHLTQSSGMWKDMYIPESGKVHLESGWTQENIVDGADGTCFNAQVILFPVYERIWNVLSIGGYDSDPRVQLDGLEGQSALNNIKLVLKDSDSDGLGWAQILKLDSIHSITNGSAHSKPEYTWDVKGLTEDMTGDPDLSLFSYATTDFSDTEVPFPIEFQRLLTLTIKKMAYARQGKMMSTPDYSDLRELERRWTMDGGRIKSKVVLPQRGHGFGRRRR